MSDGKWWRIQEWIISKLRDGPTNFSELACDVGNYDDAFYAGMIVQDLIHQGKASWNSQRMITLSSEFKEETEEIEA